VLDGAHAAHDRRRRRRRDRGAARVAAADRVRPRAGLSVRLPRACR
jgi:hypothetical protein